MRASSVFHRTFSAMNSRFTLVLPNMTDAAGQALAREAEWLVHAQERLMSRFLPGGEVSELNRRAAFEPVEVSAPLWDVLATCLDHYVRTQGAFDAAQGARTLGVRPGAEPVCGDAPAPDSRPAGFDQVQFDASSRTIRFALPEVQLDLGGIGKGIALEKVEQALRQRGVDSAFLSFGESSIAVIGSHPHGAHWPVGIADLFQEDRALHCFALLDSAMSTSGSVRQHAHIVDPRDGRTVSGLRTLSVACQSAVTAEVLSTALMVLPAAERASVLKHYPAAEIVEFVYDNNSGAHAGRLSWHHLNWHHDS